MDISDGFWVGRELLATSWYLPSSIPSQQTRIRRPVKTTKFRRYVETTWQDPYLHLKKGILMGVGQVGQAQG